MFERKRLFDILAIGLSCLIALCYFSKMLKESVFGETIIEEEIEQVDDITETDNTEIEETPIRQKIKFASFKSAYLFAIKYLNNSKGYKSVSKGNLIGDATILTINQSMEIIKEVNKEENCAYAKISSKKISSFGKDSSMEYFETEDSCFYRNGYFNGSAFTYPEEYSSSSKQDFLNYYAVAPIDLVVKLNETTIVSNGRMINDGINYILSFELSAQEACSNAIAFCMKQFGAIAGLDVSIQSGTVKCVLTMDHYGVISSLKSNSDFACYISSVPFIKIPATVGGNLSIIEKFSSVDTAVSVNDFRPVQEN